MAARKSTGYGRASRFVYVALDSSRKCTGDVNLQAPGASVGSRPDRVARRGQRKFNRSRVIQKADQVNLVPGSARADFSKPPQPIVSLVPNVGSLRKYSVVVATEPIGA